MGIIIIHGKAALQVKGPLSDLKKAIEGLEQLGRSVGTGIFGFDPIPLLDTASIRLSLQFKGTLSQFEEVINGLEKIRASVAIGTVPLPEIGTWPTPERPNSPFGWTIYAHMDEEKID